MRRGACIVIQVVYCSLHFISASESLQTPVVRTSTTRCHGVGPRFTIIGTLTSKYTPVQNSVDEKAVILIVLVSHGGLSVPVVDPRQNVTIPL